MAAPLRWARRGLTSLHGLRHTLHADEWRRLADGLPQERERGVDGIKRLTRLAEVQVEVQPVERDEGKSKPESAIRVRASSRLHALLLSRPVLEEPQLLGMQRWRSERDEKK